MGDRANIYVHNGDKPGVYLYTHWSGSELPDAVRRGLIRGKDRWDDHPYLTRILFEAMVPEGDRGGVLGYGISADLGDGDDRIVDVDTTAQSVALTEVGEDSITLPFSAYTLPGRVLWPSEGGKRYTLPGPI